MEGITIAWQESGGLSVVATKHWIESDAELVKVSVALTYAGLSLDPLSGDRPRAERFVRSILETDFKQIGLTAALLPAELDYHKLPSPEGQTLWRRFMGPGKLSDPSDSDRTMWRNLVNLHAPEE